MIILHSLELQPPTEEVKVDLEEPFGDKEGMSFSSVLPFRSIGVNFLLSTCISADCPTLLECIRFRGQEGMINIAEKISTKYQDFGLLLLDDPNGSRVSNMELKYNQDAERINKEILREWATGRGKKPVSWETLTEVLRDIGLCILASEIEAVKIKSVTSL